MGNCQASWQNKHRRRDSFVIEGRRPPWAKLPMWNGRAFKLCDEKFAGRNWEIFSQREAGIHGVGSRLGLQLYFDSSEIGRRDLCSHPPSSPHTRNARSATTMAYLRLDPWPLAMAPQPIRLGSWPLPAPSFGGQPLDSRPLASGSPWLVLDRGPLE